MKKYLNKIKGLICFLILLNTGVNYAQFNGDLEMKGVVKDEFGNPLPDVSVVLKSNVGNGVSTDTKGNYNIKTKLSGDKVIFTYIGKKKQVVPFVNGQFDVVLKDDIESLDVVVVSTGYQKISKKRTTGSVVKVDFSKQKDRLDTNLSTMLEGKVAGLTSENGKGVVVRGVSTFKGSKEPLIVLDGLPYNGSRNDINPDIIESVTVLKDAASASIYGARASNGVVVIETKKGKSSKGAQISYRGSVQFTEEPDFQSLNLMTSKELVDLQVYGADFMSFNELNNVHAGYYINPVKMLIFDNKMGKLSDEELKKELDVYRSLDNRSQLRDFYYQNPIKYQHSLSISSGNSKTNYFGNINYIKTEPDSKDVKHEEIRLSLRNNTKITSRLSSDVTIAANFNNSDIDNEMRGGYTSFYFKNASYAMLRDEAGEPLIILNDPVKKSVTEKKQKEYYSKGLFDNSYSPIKNRGKNLTKIKSRSIRVQAALNLKITDALKFNTSLQVEKGNSVNTNLFAKDSWYVRNMINAAAQDTRYFQDENGDHSDYIKVYDRTKVNDKGFMLNVPEGGQVYHTRLDKSSYTFRGQFSYDKKFGDSHFTTVIGGERRMSNSIGAKSFRMGYDDLTLAFIPVNERKLESIENTEHPYRSFNFDTTGKKGIFESDVRNVSFYSNFAYSYLEKYILTGSVRVEQSNLFGTAPEYRYRPLWSVGSGWSLKKEPFMKDINWVDQLKLRASYGLGGYLPKDLSPYLLFKAPMFNSQVGDLISTIDQYSNSELRWQSTATTNIGVDFGLWRNRLSGSVELYNRYSSDLLAMKTLDPTLGVADPQLRNYGAMVNKGIDLSLSGRVGKDFVWKPSLVFNYNNNEVIDVDVKGVVAVKNYSKGNISKGGYPNNALFSYQYAGMSKEGVPHFYTGKMIDKTDDSGNVVTGVNGKPIKIKEKVIRGIDSFDSFSYGGTTVPVYNTSFENNFSYKGFDLSFMLVNYGGHVKRSNLGAYLTSAPTINADKALLNIWKKPGDENIPGILPAYVKPEGIDQKVGRAQNYWASSDLNVMKADYLALRNISLAYSLPYDVLKLVDFNQVRFTFQMRNIKTWGLNSKGLDPQTVRGGVRRALPIPTTYTFGVSVKF